MSFVRRDKKNLRRSSNSCRHQCVDFFYDICCSRDYDECCNDPGPSAIPTLPGDGFRKPVEAGIPEIVGNDVKEGVKEGGKSVYTGGDDRATDSS